MKILTIIGTRPELIRLNIIISKLDKLYGKDHILVHTGQNYDYHLNDVFLNELEIRTPDYYLGSKGNFSNQIANTLIRLEDIIEREKPDKFLVLGDTNSSLGAIIAKRMGVKVYHMEAGNRSYIENSPEEVNRKIIDHCSDILMPYTEMSKEKLLKEGFPLQSIYVIGNPITEVLDEYRFQINNSNILKKFNLKRDDYFLVTMHRQENVDIENRAKSIIEILSKIKSMYNKEIIFPVHPRSYKRFKEFKLIDDIEGIRFIDPLGFFDFVHLENNAKVILTDSGTVQEEACILNKPCLVLRDGTERPETVKNGASIVCGLDIDIVLNALNIAIELNSKWNYVNDYKIVNTSDIVIKILSGIL